MTEETDIKDTLRPYYDSEIPAAMRRIAADPSLGDMASFAYPGVPFEEIRQAILSTRTADEFQEKFVRPLLENIVRATSDGITIGGGEYIDRGVGHLFISNHRDIVLDGALLQLLLVGVGLPTSEITFGSNLVSSPFVEDFGRSNKMYKILRGGSPRELVKNSRMLSEHLHEVVSEGRSVWISQRDGRTKNGDDHTDQGLVKMLTMGVETSPIEALAELNIVPVAISYEYESCDALKAREIYIRRRGAYEKAPGEDMRSILTGVKQYKGRISLTACPPIGIDELRGLEGENNEILRGAATLIDNRIYAAYKLFPNNYMAYDMLHGTSDFAGEYTAAERDVFTTYIDRQVDGLMAGVAGLGNSVTAEVRACVPDDSKDSEAVTFAPEEVVNRAELFEIMLEIYANPLRNKLSLS